MKGLALFFKILHSVTAYLSYFLAMRVDFLSDFIAYIFPLFLNLTKYTLPNAPLPKLSKISKSFIPIACFSS
jgi:hypothetical protein